MGYVRRMREYTREAANKLEHFNLGQACAGYENLAGSSQKSPHLEFKGQKMLRILL